MYISMLVTRIYVCMLLFVWLSLYRIIKIFQIETKKLDIKAKSKIGSLDNVKHKPGGGDRKIFDDKDYLRQKSGEHNSLNGSQVCGHQLHLHTFLGVVE